MNRPSGGLLHFQVAQDGCGIRFDLSRHAGLSKSEAAYACHRALSTITVWADQFHRAEVIRKCRLGQRGGWAFIPAGIGVAGEGVADFYEREHAAHGDVAISAFGTEHGDRIGRVGHSHIGHARHVGHAVLTHGHVHGQNGLDDRAQRSGIDANHVGAVMAHLVHDVVGHMAVERPIAGGRGDKFDGAGGSDRNEDGGLRNLRGAGDTAAIHVGDDKVGAVQVDRVVFHGTQVANADAHAVTGFYNQGCGGREDFGVHGEDVEFGHFGGVGAIGAGIDAPLVEEQCEIAIDFGAGFGRLVVAGMDDEQAGHAQAHLGHFIVMGVVHVRAGLMEGEFVFEGLAGLDGALREAADSVHAIGQEDAMPVERGGGGKAIGDIDADGVAIGRFDQWAVDRAVVTPAAGDEAGGEFVLDFFGDEVEYLDAVDDFPGELGAVGEGDGGDVVGCIGGRGGGAWRAQRGGEDGGRPREQGGGSRTIAALVASMFLRVIMWGSYFFVAACVGAVVASVDWERRPPMACSSWVWAIQ